MTRYGMLIDVKRCTGCNACIIACKSENSTRPGVSWIRIQEQEMGRFPQVSRSYTPLLCMQCGNMLCARACPSEAIVMGDKGIVQIESDKCPGCDNHPCVDACPFKALQVNNNKKYFTDYVDSYEKEMVEAHRDGVVEKCTLCSHRVSDGHLPACVQACPTQALLFGDYNDPNSALTSLVSSGNARSLPADVELDPAVLYKI